RLHQEGLDVARAWLDARRRVQERRLDRLAAVLGEGEEERGGRERQAARGRYGRTTQVEDEVIHDSFTVQRRYRSGVQAVWRAFADPEVKRRWFAEGEGFEVLEYGLDFRVGGREHGSFKVLNAPVPLGVVSNETRYFDIREG